MSLNSIINYATKPAIAVLSAAPLYGACILGEARVGINESNKEKPYFLEVCSEQPLGQESKFDKPQSFRMAQALRHHYNQTGDKSLEDTRRALEAKPNQKVYIGLAESKLVESLVRTYENWSQPDRKEISRSLNGL